MEPSHEVYSEEIASFAEMEIGTLSPREGLNIVGDDATANLQEVCDQNVSDLCSDTQDRCDNCESSPNIEAEK